MEWVFFFLGIGLLAGFLAGLFGVGGGAVLVPLLMFAFRYLEFDEKTLAHLAVGTSFATIVFTSLGSLWGHHRQGNVNWPLWRALALPLAIGVTLGSWIASQFSSLWLAPFIGLFFAFVALQMGFAWLPVSRGGLPGTAGIRGVGVTIGAVSSFVGMGGGSLTVPWLKYCNRAVHEAVGTSAACGLPIAAFGALSYWWFGQTGGVEVPIGVNWGFVYLPAFFAIVATSVPAAFLGARLAAFFSPQLLSRLFALLLFTVASYTLLSSLLRLYTLL